MVDMAGVAGSTEFLVSIEFFPDFPEFFSALSQ